VKRLVLALVLVASLVPLFAHAQQAYSLTDPIRLSVGARVYRTFDEQPLVAGSFASTWCAGAAFGWELTSPKDPTVKWPCSLIAALDYVLPQGAEKMRLRGYVGIGVLLKRAGQ